jgi:hypothetical protein
MKHPHNMEPSAFRRGEWVGYSFGVWRVWRAGIGWRAQRYSGREVIDGATLEAVSVGLDAFKPEKR